MRRRKILSLILAGAAVLALLLVFLLAIANWVLARKLSGPCGPNCRFVVDSVRLQFGGAELYGLAFRDGEEAVSLWEVEAARVELGLDWLRWTEGHPRITLLKVDGPRVMLTEGGRPKKGGGSSEPAKFSVEKIAVRNGVFVYRNTSGGHDGRLHFDEISLDGGPLGTEAGLDTAATELRTKARLEKSGRVDISLRARFFQKDPQLSLNLELLHQNLAETNAYFRPQEGMELSGRLRRAEARVTGSGQNLRARADLRFEGLDVKFLNDERRSGLAAVFANAFSDIALKGENLKEKPEEARGEVALARETDESVTSFVLRGLLEAAMKPASR